MKVKTVFTASGMQVDFYCDIPWKVFSDPFDLLSVKAELERLEKPLSFWDDEDHLLGLAFPIVFYPDYYFTVDDGSICISNDLQNIINLKKDYKLSEKQVEKILTRERCDAESTLFQGVYRFGGYAVYLFNKSGFEKKIIPMEGMSNLSVESMYEKFKIKLNESIDQFLEVHKGKKNILLMSGGADSRLLFLLLLKRKIPFEVRTVLNSPSTHDINYRDVLKVHSICQMAGVEYRINVFDYEKSPFDVMNCAVEMMPNCVHDWVGFYYALQDIDQDSIIWTGQNADAFYNFGPTERFSFSPHGVAQWFKRFYLGKPYLESLSDIEGKSGPFIGILASLGLILFKVYFRKERLNLPKNFNELERRFSDSDDFIILRNEKDNRLDGSQLSHYEKITYSEALNRLLRIKIDHCHGGKVQAICAAALLHDAVAVFPYSTCNMMSWFESFSRGWEDINYPKKYIYKYVEELSQEFGSCYADFTPCENKDGFLGDICVRDLYGYFKDLMNSQFGIQLISESKVSKREIQHFPDDMRKYEYVLRQWWVEKVSHYFLKES